MAAGLQADEQAALQAAQEDAARRLARERRVLEKQSKALLKVREASPWLGLPQAPLALAFGGSDAGRQELWHWQQL